MGAGSAEIRGRGGERHPGAAHRRRRAGEAAGGQAVGCDYPALVSPAEAGSGFIYLPTQDLRPGLTSVPPSGLASTQFPHPYPKAEFRDGNKSTRIPKTGISRLEALGGRFSIWTYFGSSRSLHRVPGPPERVYVAFLVNCWYG